MSQKLYCEKTKAILASASAITEIVRSEEDQLVSHINVFLYDTSMSKNGSMLTEEIGDLSAASFNDLPLIMTDSLGHNVFPEDPSIMPDGGVFTLTKPISEYIKASRKFEVGRVVNVIKKYVATANANIKMPVWTAQVKLTSLPFRKFITRMANKFADIKQAKLFVSSFLVGTAVANGIGKYVYDGPVTGMHIAVVKSPAYASDKSLVTGICIGNDLSCMNNLAAAASYDNVYDESLINFNNELLNFTRSLYPSASANKNSMSDDNNQKQNPEPKDKGEQTEEPKADGKETQTVQVKKEEFDALKKQIEELTKNKEPDKKSKSKDKPADEDDEDDNKEEENKRVKALENRIKQLEREKAVAKWLEKLKPIKGINALQQASLIVDKGFTDEEADNYVKSFAPLLKASANSEGKGSNQGNQRSDDALLTKFELASASSYDNYDDSIKKESNKAVNLGAAQFYSQFLKK